MRLLFTLPRFHTNMWFAVRQMIADGHAIELLVNSSAGSEDHSALKPKVMGKYPSRAEVEKAVRQFEPDVLFIRNAWAISRRASRAGKKLGIPRVLYNQLPYNRQTTLLRRLKLAHKGLPAHRITPVAGLPNGGSGDRFGRYLPWPVGQLPHTKCAIKHPPKLRVLLVGKFNSERKNQHLLIDALEQSGVADQIELTLVGSMPSEDHPHRTALDKLGQKPWVTLVGNVPFLEMADVYARHDVCILPSFGEPLGTAPVEAMAYGVVPVISNECGSAGYITHGQDGLVVDPHDMASVAQHLGRLASDRETVSALGRGATATYETHLSEPVFSSKLTALLNDVTSGRHAAGM
ncbi:MAG: glycosyltransferase family 4 protein [Pelagimonas sp.]|uniref:glycosyltransferase family 4 protein n=1 Tax=Pelagimonas sp. TaxID=2073170 RepID=UPI003D6C4F56